MGRVLTNATTVSVARQQSLDVLGTGSTTCKELEPNDIGEFGESYDKVSRNPISRRRSRRKGTIVGVDAAVELECDVTMDALDDYLEAFLFSRAVNYDLDFRAAPAVSGGYTVPALSASQASRLVWVTGGAKSLIYADGYVLAANNGLKVLTADPLVTGTTISVAGNSAETPPSNAIVRIAGVRAIAGDLALAVSGVNGTLTSGNNGITGGNRVDFTVLGLTVGQRIHVGGETNTNRFGSTAANDGTRSWGGARITSIAQFSLGLDKLDSTLVASDGTDDGTAGVAIAVDLLFGRFIRDVPVGHADFLEIAHLFEGYYPNLFETTPPTPVANPDGFEYVWNAYANEITQNLAIGDKAVCTVGFVATHADEPVDNASRKSGFSTARAPLQTGALNCSSDFARLGITDIDETGLTTDFKDMELVMNNNVTPEKVLGRRTAKYLNLGTLEIDMSTEVLFTSGLVISRIRDNTQVTMGWTMRNDDGAVAFDIPSGTLSSDGKNFERNASVKAQLKLEADSDNVFGYQMSASLFPVYPAS